MAFKERIYLRSFIEISKTLGSTLAVNEVMDQIVRQMTETMGLKGATIRMVNPKTNTLELVAAVGLSDKYLDKGPVDLDKSISDALSGRPVGIFDAVNDPRLQYPRRPRRRASPRYWLFPWSIKARSSGSCA